MASRLNILYLMIPLAILACLWIARDFQAQGGNTFFGIAETEPRLINFDHDIAVKKIQVAPGDRVQAGDTLAVLYRAELVENTFRRLGEIDLTASERRRQVDVLEQEKKLAEARLRADVRELEADIRVLQVEDSITTAYRSSLFPGQPLTGNPVTRDRLEGLLRQIEDRRGQAREELRVLEARKAAVASQADVQSANLRGEIDRLDRERERLVILSPIDGYVEDVLFGENSLIPAHRDLFKLNPETPNKIIGFIHESAEVPLTIGQEVTLVALNRPSITGKGTIVGVNPKMTELPLRLRKFIEMRSWGREVYIRIPGNNAFYISEKISITLPAS